MLSNKVVFLIAILLTFTACRSQADEETADVFSSFIVGAIRPHTIARWFTLLNLRLNGPDFHEALRRGEEHYDDPRVRDVFEHWQEMFAHNCFGERVGYGEAANQTGSQTDSCF